MTWTTGQSTPPAPRLQPATEYDVEVVGVAQEYSRGSKTAGALQSVLTLEVLGVGDDSRRPMLRYCGITWHDATRGLADAATRSLGIPDDATIPVGDDTAMRALLLRRRGRILTADTLREEKWAQFARFVPRSPESEAAGVYVTAEPTTGGASIPDDEIPF
jgi:hypothetical protein